MTADQRARAEDSLRTAREVLEASRQERRRIEQTLEQSKRVRARAIPVLRRAGYLR